MRSSSTAARRRWLAHCSALVWMSAAGIAFPAAAQPRAKGDATVLVLGDSLSAEYGLKRGTGWVALLEQRLARDGVPAKVVNASVSGETSAGGRSRLPALLAQHKPTHVVIELGANDALRGLSLATLREHLTAMSRQSKAAGARVLLAGMQLPPNYGRRYSDDFAAVFARVAKEEGTALVPFFLAGIADAADPTALFQGDRIHPSAAAHPIILDNVYPVLRPLLPGAVNGRP